MAEPRLIDANAAKEMIVNHADEFSDVLNRREKALLIGGGTSCIDKCPTVDAVPVVRCKDCYWWNKERTGLNGECVCNRVSTHKVYEIFTTPNHFCADGERRTDNG